MTLLKKHASKRDIPSKINPRCILVPLVLLWEAKGTKANEIKDLCDWGITTNLKPCLSPFTFTGDFFSNLSLERIA